LPAVTASLSASSDTDAFYDREYNTRQGVPGLDAVFADWAQRNEAAQASLVGERNLAYGSGDRERLDLYPGRPGAPLLVFIHGGFWHARTKKEFLFVAPPFVERGFSVAMIEYALAPTVSLSTIADQVRRALGFLGREAPRLGLRADRMLVSGHSAGGHLAAYSACETTDTGLPPHPVLTISGLFDLAPIALTPTLQSQLHLTPDEIVALSPARLTPRPGTRLVTTVGGAESSEFRRQNAEFAAAWNAVHVGDIEQAGGNHFTALDALSRPGSELFEAAMDLLELP
jgi:arylformamidase